MNPYTRECLEREAAQLSSLRDPWAALSAKATDVARRVENASHEHEADVRSGARTLGYLSVAGCVVATAYFGWRACQMQIWRNAEGGTPVWVLLAAIGLCVLAVLALAGVLVYSAYEQQRAIEEERLP